MKKKFVISFLLVSAIALLLPFGFAEDIYVEITDSFGSANVSAQESESIYVDLEEVSHLNTSRSELQLLEHVPNEYASWMQNITITNLNNESVVHVFNAWRDSNLSDAFLEEATHISSFKGATYESNSFIVEISPFETATINVEYSTPGINYVENCFNETIFDMLPSDATVITSDLELDTIISQICEFSVSASHEYFTEADIVALQ